LMAVSLQLLQDCVHAHDAVINRMNASHVGETVISWAEDYHRRADWLGDPIHTARVLTLIAGDALMLAAGRNFRHAVSVIPDAEHREYMILLHEETLGEVLSGHTAEIVGAKTVTMPSPEIMVQQAMDIIRRRVVLRGVAVPLGLGAAAAGSDQIECDAMVKFGLAMGEAAELTNALTAITGQNEHAASRTRTDLLDGKRTVAVGLTLARLDDDQRRAFIRALQRGDAPLAEERVEYLRQVIAGSGAIEALELLIQAKYDLAIAFLEETTLNQTSRDRLSQVAEATVFPSQHHSTMPQYWHGTGWSIRVPSQLL
jgi:geranylgeranyl diphosphate synthase type I